MNAPEGWVDPPPEMRETAQTLFQVFTSLCGAGFTEAQALTVVGQLIAAGSQS